MPKKMDKKKKVKWFVILGILSLLLINVTLISAYILINSYGKMYLDPGEQYIVNIPFKLFESPVVYGTALSNDGTPLSGIQVIVNDSNNAVLGQATTDATGQYSITLPKISDKEQVYVFLKYDNESTQLKNVALASNDYTPNFDNNLNYSKSTDNFVRLKGKVTNKDAKVENGRFEITLSKCDGETTTCNDVLDTKKYAVDIAPNEVYVVPNSQMDYSWQINSSTDLGKYKIYVQESFNGQEHTSTVYFHITS